MDPRYDTLFRKAVEEYLPDGYDWRLYKAQCWQESRFKPDAVSPAGAQGVAQIMPGTWNQWKLKDYDNPFDAEQSIMTGARYMGYLYGQWRWPRPEIDRLCLAMASYNAGLGNILNAQRNANNASLYAHIMRMLPEVTGRHSAETIDYVKKILGFWADEVTK